MVRCNCYTVVVRRKEEVIVSIFYLLLLTTTRYTVELWLSQLHHSSLPDGAVAVQWSTLYFVAGALCIDTPAASPTGLSQLNKGVAFCSHRLNWSESTYNRSKKSLRKRSCCYCNIGHTFTMIPYKVTPFCCCF